MYNNKGRAFPKLSVNDLGRQIMTHSYCDSFTINFLHDRNVYRSYLGYSTLSNPSKYYRIFRTKL